MRMKKQKKTTEKIQVKNETCYWLIDWMQGNEKDISDISLNFGLLINRLANNTQNATGEYI